MPKLSGFLGSINWQEVWTLVQTLLALQATHDPENGIDHSVAIANTQAAIAAHDVSKTPEQAAADAAQDTVAAGAA